MRGTSRKRLVEEHDMSLEKEADFLPDRSHAASGRHDYLLPCRYFHFYMFFEPNSRRTCWLPEGYAR